MRKIKTQNGITLVALIITVIILLILAVVTINAIQDNGIITHAKNATNKYEISVEKEELKMGVLTWQTLGKDTLGNYFKQNYGEEKVQLNANESITVEVESGNRYVVTEDGETILLDGTVEEPTPIQPEIILDKASISREITSGSVETETLSATLNNASGELTWISSDTSVAEISGEGNTKTITLKKAGTATITVSYGEYSATCSITVTEKQSSSANLISFTINGTTYYAEEGMSWKAWCASSYNVLNDYGDNFTVEYEFLAYVKSMIPLADEYNNRLLPDDKIINGAYYVNWQPVD